MEFQHYFDSFLRVNKKWEKHLYSINVTKSNYYNFSLQLYFGFDVNTISVLIRIDIDF